MNTLEIRNPEDLVSTYDQIEIQTGLVEDGSDMANVITNLNIDTARASDLSMGYTSYLHTTGTTASYYRFRYKISLSSSYSEYSEIYKAGQTIMHIRFRRRMRDTDPTSPFFTDADITTMLNNSIKKLWPHTYNESIDETLATSSTTRKYTYPVGVNRIDDIEYIDNSGDVMGFPTGFKLRARQILFDSPPPSGYTMRLYCDKMFRKFSELPVFLDDLVLDMMCLEAFETFEADRHQYYKYTTVANPEGGNLPSLRAVVERLQITTKDRLNSVRRVRRPGRIKST